MGKPTGFMEFNRAMPERRPVAERLTDYREIYLPFPEADLRNQTARCMDCGVPTCHSGCPLGNVIPEWNDLVYRGQWAEALDRLHNTNNFPEFTGRLCPAPCEEACVLAINEPAVTIEQIERDIIEAGMGAGRVVPRPPEKRTGKTVAVVGSGPAGLACADQLNRAGHSVTVYERADRIGGLLRYGIPDFKMEKWVIDRRLEILSAEGIVFKAGADVDRLQGEAILDVFDATVLCVGATVPRDLAVPGRALDGVHFAMDFLTAQNERVAAGNPAFLDDGFLHAHGKRVIVIGGGDTGSDCIGTSLRQGAASVDNLELFPEPPDDRPDGQPWPYWPARKRTSSSHEEGGARHWAKMTESFIGDNGRVTGLVTVDVDVSFSDGGPPKITPIPGSQQEWGADLILLAMGFAGPERSSDTGPMGTTLAANGAIATDDAYRTNIPKVYAAGDGRRGQSLIVWAISEGREAARAVDIDLMGDSRLPTKGSGDLPRG